MEKYIFMFFYKIKIFVEDKATLSTELIMSFTVNIFYTIKFTFNQSG